MSSSVTGRFWRCVRPWCVLAGSVLAASWLAAGAWTAAAARIESGGDPRACHVVFVSDSERRRTAAILQGLQGRSVLTVGDMDDFARLGGMIHLTKQNHRIGFEINPQAAERARLRISSKLLSLAKLVQTSAP